MSINVKTLMALRTQLDAIQIVIDGLIEEALNGSANSEQGICKHDGAVSIATFGNPGLKYCKSCGTQYSDHSDGAVLTGANEGGSQHG
jgi:hypothetical protein